MYFQKSHPFTTVEKVLMVCFVLTIVALIGLSVTGSAWFWVGLFAGAFATFMAAKALPFNHGWRNLIRNKVITWC